jgi:signal transduction histidine kinase
VIRLLSAGLVAGALAATPPHRLAASSPQDVQEFVVRAARYVHDHGREQAFADFNRPDGGFVQGEAYIFCIDNNGVELANGGNPKLVGKNLSDLRDAEGRRPSFDIPRLAQAQGEGWYHYIWPNAVTGRIEHKTAYVLRIDDQTACASGYYEDTPSKPDQPEPSSRLEATKP